MIKRYNYRNEIFNKNFNKRLVMTKKEQKDSKNSNKYWICKKPYKSNDAK